MDSAMTVTAYTWNGRAKTYEAATQRRAKFLKGPIPWPWIEKAAKLPGKALIVGLALWRLSGAVKSKTIRLGNSEVEALGVGRSAKSRALRELEQAGLIAIDQKPGCLPMVSILDLPIECS